MMTKQEVHTDCPVILLFIRNSSVTVTVLVRFLFGLVDIQSSELLRVRDAPPANTAPCVTHSSGWDLQGPTRPK
jgi:hypothetical protein